MRKPGLLLIFLQTFFYGFAQNTIGLPDIVNYSKNALRTGSQNRQIRQDKKGWMYFANNEGVLVFDGIHWKTYPLPNKSIVRSIGFGPDNNLYTGGQDEFGYFAPTQNGGLVFKSLKDVLPKEERSFTDVWNIFFHKDLIFFQTSDRIYQLGGKTATVYKSTHWRFMGLYDDQLLAQDEQKGLLLFNNGVWAPFLQASELPAEAIITAVTSIGKGQALLTTIKNGCFILQGKQVKKLNAPFTGQLAQQHISGAAMVNENHIAIGTSLGGCFIIDKEGNLVRSFTRKEGLQNNNVLDVFLDREKNLWLGLDNGIDFIAYNNAIKYINPQYLNEGLGYASYLYKNNLYIGTSNGLYRVPLYAEDDLSYIKGDFEPVKNSRGQVWNLSEVNGQLLMGHHEGAFVINNNEAIPMDHSSGFWTFQPMQNVLPASLMITGTYNGINFYQYKDGRFSHTGIHAPFESARFVAIQNNHIWVAHPYKGIFRVELNNHQPSIKKYGSKEGVASVNGNYIFKIKNRIVLTTEDGIFEYNSQQDRFEASEQYNLLFGDKHIRYLKEDAAGNVWFVYEKNLGVVDHADRKPQIIYFPELTNKFVAGFEHVNPIDKNNVLIGGEKGFYHINYEQYKKLKFPLQVQITRVVANNDRDSLLFGGYNTSVNEAFEKQACKASISHNWNSFHFVFAAPVYAQQANIEYSYFLEGFDENWSEFSKRTEKEYTNLPAGAYTFKVKARNNLGNESEVSSYSFSVLPPWYQTWWAYSAYLLGIVMGIYLLYRMQKRKFLRQQLRHEEEQKQLQYLHQLELEKAEKELIRLRNEKLESEIQNKNTELASTAMHLVQKAELLGKVKEQMLKMKKHSDAASDAEDLKKILRTLSEEDKMDKQWEQFAIHFDTVHSDFLTNIKAKYPRLTASELKLCAYLRMNLSTKEIAQLMNISVRGVEISRYRLRKKLGIPTETNLFDFLIKVTSPEIKKDNLFG